MGEVAEEALMRALHEEHAAALWSYALHLTSGDRIRAEDVVQETLLRAWRSTAVLDQSQGSARAWLFTVARRIAIDGWRSASARSEVVTDAPPERAVGDGTDRAVQGWLVAEALAELSERHREVLLLCYFQGYSVADAALRLGVAEGTVKSRTHYALRALRLVLEERGVTQ
ncbi:MULTISPECIES: sigma-70 family RNA polymerase sigma factor [Amycolatopsis]|uniref:RNA polymerase sigma factor n=2 Tax=Amycolatopsis eburnea TaxID=2267691 RepID=A0A427SWL1_9PSEU|nr:MULTISPECIES: sigma-70 family RNA polymerase sigma factor [Amycolatopsis]NBH11475.1 sigma-70 family RNA polymerase sigma factor [Amycolatopsis sp. SID8362]NED48167.1 sigma-70 family RNA polymerase sigma factor [Amycolatopsis sp. SID8362]RSD08667.1 sigma-70 family RNA polymerase sigma factor [Amycolatopsis eburnea]